MCVGGKKQAPAPAPPPPVAPAPTREEIAATVASDAAAEKVALVTESKKKVQKRQGLFSNILTTTLGDPFYGQRTVNYATFGGRK